MLASAGLTMVRFRSSEAWKMPMTAFWTTLRYWRSARRRASSAFLRALMSV